jgi:hypothetical protein
MDPNGNGRHCGVFEEVFVFAGGFVFAAGKHFYDKSVARQVDCRRDNG